MKKILLIIEHLGSGGAERQICGLAVMLTKAGYPCRLITYVEKQFYEPFLKENGVEYELVHNLKNKCFRVFRMARYAREFGADIIISFLPSVNLAICLSKLFYRKKIVVSERNNNTSLNWKDRLRFSLYRLADAIVPNSLCQGEFIRKNFPFLENKIHPIINFVDFDRFSPAEKLENSGFIRIVTVGRYTPQKNILTYLKAIRKVKEKGLPVRFDWYGDKEYDADYYASVEQEYHNLCIADYLSLHSTTPKIEDVYKGADVFCLPSLYEGYPNVIVEAMACELPILCSNRFENPYIVEDAVNGFLFDPENIDDIVNCISKVIALNPTKRKEIGERNRQLCLKRNSEGIFLKSYVDLIEAL